MVVVVVVVESLGCKVPGFFYSVAVDASTVLVSTNTSTVFANVKTANAEHEHLHGVCERENCTCTLPQCGHAPPRCF